MKNNIVLSTAFLLIITSMVFVSCNSNRDYATPEEVIQANIDFMNAEDLEGTMSTIYPEGTTYETTENLVKQLFSIYDLNYKIEKLEVVDEDDLEAVVDFTQLTQKINGPEFKNNRIKGTHIIRKDGDSWKIYSTKITNTELLN